MRSLPGPVFVLSGTLSSAVSALSRQVPFDIRNARDMVVLAKIGEKSGSEPLFLIPHQLEPVYPTSYRTTIRLSL